ncbi:nodulation protein NoeA [Aurantibacter aestuarii]|uniref:Nodulation protein NoeA n=1 Tax=Aurantibacter aestuarii TaxID=1266046 RepID=A0A2T1N4P6_9FLAO|nr:nodulation protein NoeA [Aurantibacter aestuarii]PSG86074.1 nodulation protein NoeA [Aurantibacter aestuarii]
MSLNAHSSSFRDPSGFIFVEDGLVKRQINPIYFETYSVLNEADFYKKAIEYGLLIPHEELFVSKEKIIIQPEQIPFITYPYEWSFNQYKEAALLTLKFQKFALEHNFSLKDASAFNIVFNKGKAIFIDTLSLDIYKEKTPWRAYKQFITHFLGPLVLAHYHGAASLKLMSNFIDGIPLSMLSTMLPISTKLNPFLYTNIHLLAKFEAKHSEDYTGTSKTKQLSKKGQLNILEALYNYIKKLTLKESTEWGNYYTKTNYSDDAFKEKSVIINNWISKINPKTLIDVGGNDGTFVRKIEAPLDLALVCDIDNNAVDANYRQIKKDKEYNILPFVLDVLNPTANIGFNNKERFSFIKRAKQFAPEVTMALAVIHHMSLSGNINFDMSAQFFASFSNHLIIEFPKRTDSWVQRLLKSKGEFETYFDFYNESEFELAYQNYFQLEKKVDIGESDRLLYFYKLK